jgi:hypothetical protein
MDHKEIMGSIVLHAYLRMIPFKILGGAIAFVPYALVLSVVAGFVPFRMDKRFELLDGGGKLKVGENAGAEVAAG